MTKRLIASFAALSLLAGPALAATNTKAPNEKTKVLKHSKKQNVKDTQPKSK